MSVYLGNIEIKPSSGSPDGKTYIDGYEYVDLGLPSGLKWCTHNVGATDWSDQGLFFQRGCATGYGRNQAAQYSYWANSPINGYNSDVNTDALSSWEGWANPSATSTTEYRDNDIDLIDGAVAYMGGGKTDKSSWHTPSYTNLVELASYTNQELVTISSIKTPIDNYLIYAQKFTNKSDESKCIYMPCCMSFAEGKASLTYLQQGRVSYHTSTRAQAVNYGVIIYTSYRSGNTASVIPAITYKTTLNRMHPIRAVHP